MCGAVPPKNDIVVQAGVGEQISLLELPSSMQQYTDAAVGSAVNALTQSVEQSASATAANCVAYTDETVGARVSTLTVSGCVHGCGCESL
jgi:hypothetical protein